MAGLSGIAVPVLLDSIISPQQLFLAWVRMYHYGHLALPTMGVGTFGLWAWVAVRRRAAKKPWRAAAVAGITTVLMVPFTWLVMVRTNNELFRLEAAGSEIGGMSIGNARDLVNAWSQLHAMRSAFPLVGAMVGAIAVSCG